MTEIKAMSMRDIGAVKQLFSAVFSAEPWNDDWSDDIQLHSYISEYMSNGNSLTFGLFMNGELTGASLGCIKHWWEGTEYNIGEFFVKTSEQGQGLGSAFLSMIEEELIARGIRRIFLQTNRNLPAFGFYRKNGYELLQDHVSLVKNL
ncbi:MAG TPA: GNAT family N-acetyltransferase [Ruminococcus sp.]|nr:GNAT family N-acetyltransferase [Ruminococcus sp.]